MSSTQCITPKPETASNVESLGLTRPIMTAFLVALLRQHFASADQVENPYLRDLLWTPGPATPLLIESWSRWDPQNAGTLPAIVVKPHTWNYNRLGINDQVMGTIGQGGTEYFETELVGSHSILAVGGVEAGDEAELLGWEVFSFLMSASGHIRETFRNQLNRFSVAQLGEPFIVEEAKQLIAVPVPLAYRVAKRWAVLADLPPIGRLQLVANIRLNRGLRG